MSKTYLLTGVAGFIASKTAEFLLKARYKVVGIDNLNDYYDPRLKTYRLKALQKFPHFIFKKVDIENKFGNELLAYPDYENKGCYVLSANESYTSLLEAHQIDNNYIIILNKEG